jgi:hypothetical protein
MCVWNDTVSVGARDGEGLAGQDEDSGEACVRPRGAWDVSSDMGRCDCDFVKMGAGGYMIMK